jgi:hypothetical protein
MCSWPYLLFLQCRDFLRWKSKIQEWFHLSWYVGRKFAMI